MAATSGEYNRSPWAGMCVRWFCRGSTDGWGKRSTEGVRYIGARSQLSLNLPWARCVGLEDDMLRHRQPDQVGSIGYASLPHQVNN